MPKALFVFASIICALVAGMAVERHQVFPHGVLVDAEKTLRASLRSLARRHDGSPRLSANWVDPDDVTRNGAGEIERVHFIATDRLVSPVLFAGGPWRFADICPAPANGCLAVEYTGRGEVAAAWPFYPDRIFGPWPPKRSGSNLEALPFETPPGWRPADNATVFSVAKYDNGDLLAVVQLRDAFPYAGGLVRVGADGSVKWRRWDYVHHRIAMVDSGHAWVVAMRLQEHRSCEKAYMDVARLIDGSGAVVKEIAVADALIASPYSRLLYDVDDCDPTHVNSIVEIGPAVADHDEALREDSQWRDAEFSPGDLVVSFRSFSAFGIIDGTTHRLKYVVRGTFRAQHSVVHVGGGTFALLDNLGAGKIARVLLVDPVRGREQTIYPAYFRSHDGLLLPPSALSPSPANSPVATPVTGRGGNVSLSPDGERAIVSYSRQGQAVEFRVSDGQVLTLFNDFHEINQGDDLRMVSTRTRLSSVGYSREARR